MSDSRKGKSIWKRYEKPRGEARVENDGELYYRINRKTGRIETNLLEWERSWKNVKILKYPTRFANELRLGVRDNYTLEQILEANVMLPGVDTAREYWTPTPEQNAELIRPRGKTRKIQRAIPTVETSQARRERQEEGAERGREDQN